VFLVSPGSAGSEGAVVVQTLSPSSEFDTTSTSPRCPGCRERDLLNAGLREELRQTKADLEKMRERLARNANNSSTPPSHNPLDAPKPNTGRKPSGRKRGGQPDHPPANRQRVPREQLAEPPIDCIPHNCEHCNTQLTGVDPMPLVHQVTEIPPITPEVREYLRHQLQCPECGHWSRAQLPAGVSESAFGPRLQAFIGLCTGCYHLSKRQTEELLETALNVPISLGGVCCDRRQLTFPISDN
jgi:transposase